MFANGQQYITNARHCINSIKDHFSEITGTSTNNVLTYKRDIVFFLKTVRENSYTKKNYE